MCSSANSGTPAGTPSTNATSPFPWDSPAVLNGEENTEVAIKFKNAVGEIKELKLTRKRFSTVRNDSLTWSGDETAILKIHSFSGGYNRETIEKLVGEAARAKFLILDLRGNGGGGLEVIARCRRVGLVGHRDVQAGQPQRVHGTHGGATFAARRGEGHVHPIERERGERGVVHGR